MPSRAANTTDSRLGEQCLTAVQQTEIRRYHRPAHPVPASSDRQQRPPSRPWPQWHIPSASRHVNPQATAAIIQEQPALTASIINPNLKVAWRSAEVQNMLVAEHLTSQPQTGRKIF